MRSYAIFLLLARFCLCAYFYCNSVAKIQKIYEQFHNGRKKTFIMLLFAEFVQRVLIFNQNRCNVRGFFFYMTFFKNKRLVQYASKFIGKSTCQSFPVGNYSSLFRFCFYQNSTQHILKLVGCNFQLSGLGIKIFKTNQLY